jgi:hypothetical protein
MPKPGEMNRIPGLYRSACCGALRYIKDIQTFPPCPGGGKGSRGKCSGQNAEWSFVRPT